jgi:hypothetical protein
MARHNPMNFHLIRRADLNRRSGTYDDTIKVTKLGENSVRVVYTEKTRDGNTTDVMTFNYHQLLCYLHRAFFLLSLDDDPFQTMQVVLPGYPMSLIPVAEIKKHSATVLELVMSVCLTWPAQGSQGTPIPPNPSNE